MWIIHEGLTRINSWMDLFRIPLDPPFSLQNELLITILPLPFPSHWNLKVRNIGKWTSVSHMINENFQIKWFENMLCKKLKLKKIFHAQILFLSLAVPPDLRGTLKIWLIICSYHHLWNGKICSRYKPVVTIGGFSVWIRYKIASERDTWCQTNKSERRLWASCFEIVIFHSFFYSLLLNDVEFGRLLSEGVCALAVDFKAETGWKNKITIYNWSRIRGRRGKFCF